MKLGVFDIEVTDITFIKASSDGRISLELVDNTKIDITLPQDVYEYSMVDAIEVLRRELDECKRPTSLTIEMSYV